MEYRKTSINGIPAIIWGAKSEKAYIFVHGKKSRKEEAEPFAQIAQAHGYQVISFDLPEHGERTNEKYPCDIWNGMRDLETIFRYAQPKWKHISLYANSLGAYFSLMTYKDMQFDKCLFHSPILDMERLIKNMMKWFNVDENTLQEKREIKTPMGETLSWKYYSFVRNNRIAQWNIPTSILYGTADNLTERAVVDEFANKYKCNLDIVEGGQHFFASKAELSALDKWIETNV
jgi:alpha-beta hydrolase superfamily lysophospholipase